MSGDKKTEFLEAYKELEATLRTCLGPKASVLDYESSLPPEQSDILRLARQVRNFMQHNPNAGMFLTPEEGLTSFLRGLANRLVMENRSVSDGVYKMTPVKLGDTVEAACKALSKGRSSNRWGRDWMPVVGSLNQVTGALTAVKCLDLVYRHGMNAELGSVWPALDQKASLKQITVVDAGESLAPYLAGMTELTGASFVITKNNRYLGVVAW